MQTPAVGILFCLNLIIFTNGLSIEKTYDSTDLPATDLDESSTAKEKEVKKDEFVFENGVLKVVDNTPKSTTEANKDEAEEEVLKVQDISTPEFSIDADDQEQEEYDDDDDSQDIVFTEEAIKVIEMLTDEVGEDEDEDEKDVDTNFPVENNGNITVDHYHDYEMLQDLATRLETQYPYLVTKYSIGNSVQGREILVLKLRSVDTVPFK